MLCLQENWRSNNFSGNLFTFLSFDILCILKFIQYLYALFLRTSQVLVRLIVFFERLKPQKFLTVLLFSMKHSCLLTAKITPDVYFLKSVQELGDSLHIMQKFI